MNSKPKKKGPVEPIPRNTAACREGDFAYGEGLTIDECPYIPGKQYQQRSEWMAGWLDARTVKECPLVFG